MTPPTSTAHPDHAAEQAYIERAHRAELQARERLEHAAESAPDKVTAREMRKQALEKLRQPVDLDALCFGRIDFDDGKRFYLGRGAVHDEDKGLLVINWRVPKAKAFYTASRADPQDVELRRRFQLDQLRLLGIVDDVFVDPPAPASAAVDAGPAPDSADEPAESEVEPQLVDAILAEMDRARGADMRDIVATIEARQYELISDAVDGLLVIQGGPGSGKTAIALHRAAWLLFNHQDELTRSGVLVVGPNRAFMEYVAQVLPSLGEAAVTQSAIDRLADLDDVRVRATESRDAAIVKGDLRMVDVLNHAVRERVRLPKDALPVTVGRSRVSLPVDEIVSLVESARTGRTYLTGREAFRRELVSLVAERVSGGRNPFRSGASAADIEMAVSGSGGLADRVWPTITAPEVLRDLLNSRQRLTAAGQSLSPGERALLQRERERSIRDERWTASDIPLLDEIDALIRGTRASYGYVLVDEAQDLTPMQLRMVWRRSPTGRGTLVGDVAQATGVWRHDDWDDLLESAGLTADSRIAELAIGYRVPRQVMELANALLPRVAPQLAATTAVREGAEDPVVQRVAESGLVAALVAETDRRIEGERTVGLIVPLTRIDDMRAALNEAGLDVGDVLSDGLSRQVTLLSAAQAKGLEFDHVIVVDPSGIAGPDDEWAYVYVALTRATRTLTVLHHTLEALEHDPVPAEEPPVDEAPAGPGPPPVSVRNARTGPVLGARFTEALLRAKFIHSSQHRRGSSVPYFAHLQAVCALVLEDGGSEDEAIAALLHDAVEDHGPDVLDTIVDEFGGDVALIVATCTDPEGDLESTWRERKAEHIRELESAGPLVRRVALAEKLDNARGLLRDYRRLGPRLWERMDVDPDDLLWYVSALADLFATERPGDMASEFQDTVERLLDLVSAPDEAVVSD